MEKSVGYYGAYRLKIRCTNGVELWVTVQALRYLSILEFWKLITMDLPFTQVILYPSGIFEGIEE